MSSQISFRLVIFLTVLTQAFSSGTNGTITTVIPGRSAPRSSSFPCPRNVNVTRPLARLLHASWRIGGSTVAMANSSDIVTGPFFNPPSSVTNLMIRDQWTSADFGEGTTTVEYIGVFGNGPFYCAFNVTFSTSSPAPQCVNTETLQFCQFAQQNGECRLHWRKCELTCNYCNATGVLGLVFNTASCLVEWNITKDYDVFSLSLFPFIIGFVLVVGSIPGVIGFFQRSIERKGCLFRMADRISTCICWGYGGKYLRPPGDQQASQDIEKLPLKGVEGPVNDVDQSEMIDLWLLSNVGINIPQIRKKVYFQFGGFLVLGFVIVKFLLVSQVASAFQWHKAYSQGGWKKIVTGNSILLSPLMTLDVWFMLSVGLYGASHDARYKGGSAAFFYLAVALSILAQAFHILTWPYFAIIWLLYYAFFVGSILTINMAFLIFWMWVIAGIFHYCGCSIDITSSQDRSSQCCDCKCKYCTGKCGARTSTAAFAFLCASAYYLCSTLSMYFIVFIALVNKFGVHDLIGNGTFVCLPKQVSSGLALWFAYSPALVFVYDYVKPAWCGKVEKLKQRTVETVEMAVAGGDDIEDGDERKDGGA